MHTEQTGPAGPLSPFFGATLCASLALLFALLVLAPLTAAPAYAAQKAPAHAATAPAAHLPGEEIAMGMIERGRPSDKDNIAVLTPLAGTWDYVESFWTDPKAAPQHATGFVTNEMILDRHYLSSKAAGSLNIGREQIPFEGMELIGFDNAKKSLSFVEVDTLTSGMMIGGGKFDEKQRVIASASGMRTGSGEFDGKERVIRETGRFTNPLTGVEQGFRSELKFVDTENYKRTVFALDKAGKETKLIEIDYSRRK